MISLSRHIELLLLDHDCVIVPSFGGFIANLASAKYIGKENEQSSDGDTSDSLNLFLPPYRTIGFNPQLQLNDGLLVQSYMQAYDASYPEAYLQMEKEVENMKYVLQSTGDYEIEGIGVLHYSLDNGVTFTANESGILTPSLYGTYSFEVRSLEDVKIEREKLNASINITPIQTETDFQQTAVATPTGTPAEVTGGTTTEGESKDKKRGITIHIARPLLDLSIAAAAAVILFFFVSYPSIKRFNNEADTCIAGSPYVAQPTQKVTVKVDKKNDAPKLEQTPKLETPAKADEPKVAETDKAAETTPKVEEVKKVETPKVEEPKKVETPKNYTIVLASYVTAANSADYIKKLDKMGYAEGEFVKDGKVNRVIYSRFATEAEAYTALASLRKQSTEFSEAWIVKLK